MLPAASDGTTAVALGDVDGDGDQDALIGNGGDGQDRLLLNDGKGRFTDATATQLPVDADDCSAVALADLDGDGDRDALIGSSSGCSAASQERLYLNDGAGTFTDVTATRLPVDTDFYTEVVELEDIDGDGDRDALVGSLGRNSRSHAPLARSDRVAAGALPDREPLLRLRARDDRPGGSVAELFAASRDASERAGSSRPAPHPHLRRETSRSISRSAVRRFTVSRLSCSFLPLTSAISTLTRWPLK